MAHIVSIPYFMRPVTEGKYYMLAADGDPIARCLIVPADHPRFSEAMSHADISDQGAVHVTMRCQWPEALKNLDAPPTIDEALDALGPPPARRMVPVLGGSGQVRV